MVSARSNLVGRLGVFPGTSAGDFSVGFRAAVTIELPSVADFLDFVEIEFGDEQFILVAAGLLDDFAARIAEVALAVEFADFPGSFGADAIDGSDEVSVGDGVGGLLEFPKIFGETGDGGGGVVDNFRSIPFLAVLFVLPDVRVPQVRRLNLGVLTFPSYFPALHGN